MRRWTVAVLLAAGMAAAAGCGGGGGSPATPAGGGATATTVATVPTDNPVTRARNAANAESQQQRQLDAQSGQADPTLQP